MQDLSKQLNSSEQGSSVSEIKYLVCESCGNKWLPRTLNPRKRCPKCNRIQGHVPKYPKVQERYEKDQKPINPENNVEQNEIQVTQ